MAKLAPLTLKGVPELVAALKGLDDAMVNIISAKAAHAGAEVISRAAQARAPTLSVAKQIKVYSDTEVDKAFNRRIRRAFVGAGHFVSRWFEFGTEPRFQKSTGRYTGRMPVKAFMRPALDEAGDRAREAMQRIVEQEIEAKAQRY